MVSTDAGGASWRIACDMLVTRRKLYQIVVNPQGDHAFHARRLGDCLEWLGEQEVEQVWLDFHDLTPVLCAVPVRQRKD